MSQREIRELTNDPLTHGWNSRHVKSGGRRAGKRGGESPSDLLRQHREQSSRGCSASSTPAAGEKTAGTQDTFEGAPESQVHHVNPTKIAAVGETSAVLAAALDIKSPISRRHHDSIRSAVSLPPSRLSQRQPSAKSESPSPTERKTIVEPDQGRSREPSELTILSSIGSDMASEVCLSQEYIEDESRTPAYVELMTELEGKPVLAYFHHIATRDIALTLDVVADDETIMTNKIINEEYKIWKKNAPYLYDVMYSKALDWPTLTTQWFRDVQNPPRESCSVHRLLIGTHTSNDAPNYLQIAQFSLPILTTDPEDYDAEREEIGSGHNPGKKSQLAPKLNIIQKIDHDGEINKARYMPQKQDLIATMGVNGKVLVFDRTKHSSQPTGKVNPQIELVGHTKEGFGLNWHPKREGELVTGSEDNTVKLWNIKDFTADGKKIKATRTFTHHTAVVNDVQFHPQIEKAFATVSDDMTLQIIDTTMDSNSRAAFKTDNAHSDAINSVSWNTGVEYLLATGSADKTIGIWDMRNLSIKLHSCEAHHDVVSKVEWHPFEKAVLASSGYDRRINFWDLNKCGEEQTPEDAEDGPPELLFMHGGHTNRISDFSFNLNDPWLMCSAAEDNLIQIWKTAKSLIGKDTADVPVQELEH